MTLYTTFTLSFVLSFFSSQLLTPSQPFSNMYLTLSKRIVEFKLQFPSFRHLQPRAHAILSHSRPAHFRDFSISVTFIFFLTSPSSFVVLLRSSCLIPLYGHSQ
ncbi:hypothetical protein L228DRAFT_5062 [Xylona heveae TC161]|uniref:Secreted protein n=1 Tax=Xylona heveae (strain CBS 132557 / TC161) TaxID=1328760 RepID=A0A165JDE5_XYLHT|nr:hypothetical protein L228DRAFT_5062 [Xylona heveae TC161]KZF26090.1 hypothetical protein L228DRAFT_5062 [Xylona heveae TC161]